MNEDETVILTEEDKAKILPQQDENGDNNELDDNIADEE